MLCQWSTTWTLFVKPDVFNQWTTLAEPLMVCSSYAFHHERAYNNEYPSENSNQLEMSKTELSLECLTLALLNHALSQHLLWSYLMFYSVSNKFNNSCHALQSELVMALTKWGNNFLSTILVVQIVFHRATYLKICNVVPPNPRSLCLCGNFENTQLP